MDMVKVILLTSSHLSVHTKVANTSKCICNKICIYKEGERDIIIRIKYSAEKKH